MLTDTPVRLGVQLAAAARRRTRSCAMPSAGSKTWAWTSSSTGTTSSRCRATRRRALRVLDDARGLGRADGAHRVRTPWSTATATATPTCRPTWPARSTTSARRAARAGSSSARARAGSSKDYDEYGYEFGTPGTRLKDLADGLARIHARWDVLNPPPTRKIPVMIGGKGEQKTLRLVARYADYWHSFVRPDELPHKYSVIEKWAEREERDTSTLIVSNELQRRGEDVADRALRRRRAAVHAGLPRTGLRLRPRAVLARVARRQERLTTCPVSARDASLGLHGLGD